MAHAFSATPSRQPRPMYPGSDSDEQRGTASRSRSRSAAGGSRAPLTTGTPPPPPIPSSSHSTLIANDLPAPPPKPNGYHMPNRPTYPTISTQLAPSEEPEFSSEDEAFAGAKSPVKGMKLKKILGDDAPDHYIKEQNIDAVPWYLRPLHGPTEILINPDGGVRGGTLPALIERLTMHAGRDATFNNTFLMTFKSFSTVDEVFEMLVQRFYIQPPEGLTPEERVEWTKEMQAPIRLRVINVFKSMIVEPDILEKEDMGLLTRIEEFAQRAMAVVPAAKQLTILARKTPDTRRQMTINTPSFPPPSILPKSGRRIKLLDLDPLELARQLTIMESEIFFKIRQSECLARAKDSTPEGTDNIKTVISTTNKIADWVADSVLQRDDPRKRAGIIKQFIAVADRCRGLNNFSTMAALIAGLNCPPIRRLKRTWEQVNGRTIAQLDELEKTLDSGKNFTQYKALLARIDPPCVPFLGVYLTLLTFIQDGNKDMLVKEGNLINFNKRQKAAEVIREIKQYQNKPYNLTKIPQIRAFIDESLAALEVVPDFWAKSLELEPREREDEKMARLLQESGFL